VWARNITGVVQVDAHTGVQLKPGEWVDLTYEVALSLWRARAVELKSPEDLKGHLWKAPDGALYLFWMSPFSMGDGYATAAENMVLELARQGVAIQITPCWFVSRHGLQQETVNRLETPHPGPIKVGLCMATPGEFKKLPTPYKIGLTMYEADDPLHNMPEWRHDCTVVDMLLVPSEYCKGVFSSFVRAPIKVAPLAINPIYYADEKARKRPRPKFVFGMHGTLSGRKAPLETIQAFCRAFPPNRYPDVELQLKTRLEICGMGQGQLPSISDKRVKIISEDWLPSHVKTWLSKTVDVYLYPSKGEGFGMTPREAMAAGCPTILSNNTGMAEVCNDEYNWPIPVHHLENSPLGGSWRIPDWDAVIEVMKWMYHNREAAYAKAARCSKWFIENYGAAKAAVHLKGILEAIDPSQARREPIEVAETVQNRAGLFHEMFFQMIKTLIPPPAKVIDIGVGEGILYTTLCNRGYEVVGIVAPGRLPAMAQKLRDAGVTPVLHEATSLGQADRVGVRGDLVVSHNVFQDLRIPEIAMVLRAMLDIAPVRLFSVPTVYYPKPFSADAELHRLGYWEDLLRIYDYEAKYYGQGHQYMYASIHGLDTGVRGVVVRRPRGRVVDGTWRPLTDSEGSRSDAK